MLVSKDGTLRYVSASTAPIKSSDREIMGVVVVFRDITRIRKRKRSFRIIPGSGAKSRYHCDGRHAWNIEYVIPIY